MITEAELLEIMPFAGKRAHTFSDPLNAAMAEFGIDTPMREAAFIAQIAHESGSFRYVRELASGEAYEDRADLGNTEPGDGKRFKGRGLIQVTGRHWYERAAAELGLDCVEHPEILEDPVNACRVSAWWWRTNKVNALADLNDIKKVTRRVNGGLNGLAERQAFYDKAKRVFGID